MSKKTLFGHEWQRDVKAIWGLFFLLLALSTLLGMVGGWFYVSRNLDGGIITNVMAFFKFAWAAVQGWPWDSNGFPDVFARKVFWYGPSISMATFVVFWFGILIFERRNKQQEGE